MKRILLLCLGCFLAYTGVSQEVSRAYIEEMVRSCKLGAVLDSATLFILDGVPYQQEELFKDNNAGKRLASENILRLDYVSPEQINLPHRPRSGVVLISSLHQQKKDYIKKELNKVLQLFEAQAVRANHISEDAKEPVLIIDGKAVFPADAKGMLHALRPGDIYAINHYDCAFPAEWYGQNAKNGLVQIWTKKGRK